MLKNRICIFTYHNIQSSQKVLCSSDRMGIGGGYTVFIFLYNIIFILSDLKLSFRKELENTI